MKAIICTKYGPPEVLQLKEVDKPKPKDNEILVKIRATTVTASDCIVRGSKFPFWHPIGLMMRLVIGFTRPRNPILGMVLAGDVESRGTNAKKFKVGEQVFGWTIKSTMQMNFGTYAEYKCLPEDSLILPMPSNVTYEEAAAVPYGGMMALPFLKKGNIQSVQKLLIYGASGSIGTSAVQLAKYFGTEVTAVCSNKNFELVKSLGADKLIDYTKDDSESKLELYDLVFDAVGKSKSSKLKLQSKKALNDNGKYISVDDSSPKQVIEDLVLLKKLTEQGKLKPVIGMTYPLEEIAEAHKYVDMGHKRGNVVITVAHNDKI